MNALSVVLQQLQWELWCSSDLTAAGTVAGGGAVSLGHSALHYFPDDAVARRSFAILCSQGVSVLGGTCVE